MPRLRDRGTHYEYDLPTDWGAIIGAIMEGTASMMMTALKKKMADKGEEEDQVELLKTLSSMGTERANEILKNNPQLRLKLLDKDRVPKEQYKAMQKGAMEPLQMSLQETTLEKYEKQKALADAGKAQADEIKARAEGEIMQTRASLLNSENPALALTALQGNAPSVDELTAFMVGGTDPETLIRKTNMGVIGTEEYKKKMFEDQFAALLKEVNPQTPEELQAVRNMAGYIAGLTDTAPSKLPKSLERIKTELDARRVSISERTLQLQQANQQFQQHQAIQALALQLQPRLRKTPYEGKEYSLAEGMLRRGEYPEDLPPDLLEQFKLDEVEVKKAQMKVDLERAQQTDVKMQALLDMARKAVDAGDEKSGHRYFKMAQDRFHELYGIKPEPSLFAKLVAGSMYPAKKAAEVGAWLIGASEETATAVRGALEEMANSPAATALPKDVTLWKAAGTPAGIIPGPPQVEPKFEPKPTPKPTPKPEPKPAPLSAKLTPEQNSYIQDQLKIMEVIANQPGLPEDQKQWVLTWLFALKQVVEGKRPFEDLMMMRQMSRGGVPQ